MSGKHWKIVVRSQNIEWPDYEELHDTWEEACAAWRYHNLESKLDKTKPAPELYEIHTNQIWLDGSGRY